MSAPSLLVANWKMNLGIGESVALAKELASFAKAHRGCELWLTPSYPSIASVCQSVSASPIRVGAQNVHWADKGAFTGEVSTSMLTEVGADFVITGHSERRHLFHEDDAMVVRRSVQALKQSLTVIFCVGETLQEREAGTTLPTIDRQLQLLLQEPELTSWLAKIVIAYEPVWAIGTGKVATIQDIDAAHQHISSVWCAKTGASSIPILYGGSVTPANYGEIISHPFVAGALVGGASLTYESFTALAEIGERSLGSQAA